MLVNKATVKEFMEVYGYIILAVLVVMGILAYFGVLNSPSFIPFDCDKFCQSVNTSHCAIDGKQYVACYVFSDCNMTVVYDKNTKEIQSMFEYQPTECKIQ